MSRTSFALLVGVDSLVLHYRSVEDLPAAELMIVAEGGMVIEVLAHYGEGRSR